MHNKNLCLFDIWAPAVIDNPNDYATQLSIYKALDFDSDTIITDEVNYIEREVSRRLCR